MNVLLIHDADEIRARVLQILADGLADTQIDLWDPTRQGAPGRTFPWRKYDVVFLDERPANGDGIDWLLVLKDARAAGLVPPMILLTVGTNAAREQKARDAGAVDVVRKVELSATRAAQAAARAVSGALGPKVAAHSIPSPAVTTTGSLNIGAIGQAVASTTVRLPGYRVMRKIGEGGMSKVYLAERESDRLPVVLKMLDPSLHGDSQFRQRFVREYQVLARINNTHVVKIYDQSMTDDYGYIAMEYFAGGDLKTRLRPPGMAPATALQLFQQILIALDAVHTANVVHRDLKPQNMMFRGDREIALLDFGLAREVDQISTLTQKGVVLATPLYMSPEQCMGVTHDARGDLYSAGIILYEMLTGNTPYTGKNAPELAYQHVHAPIAQLPNHVLSLQPLIDALLAKKPERRPQSARAILDKFQTR